MSEDDLKYFYDRLAEEQDLRRRSAEVATGAAHRLFARLYQRRIEELEGSERRVDARRPPIFDPI
jgi:hypothetical protein